MEMAVSAYRLSREGAGPREDQDGLSLSRVPRGYFSLRLRERDSILRSILLEKLRDSLPLTMIMNKV